MNIRFHSSCYCKELCVVGSCCSSSNLLKMGLLSEGTPLSWPDTKKYSDHVRKHGIQQFINQYHLLKNRKNDCLKWGDEVK